MQIFTLPEETLTGHARPDVIEARFYVLSGHVQGVGFRPFVYRLATDCGVSGWIENWMGEVAIHAEGPLENLQRFESQLIQHAPPHASPVITRNEVTQVEHLNSFSIRHSNAGKPTAIRIVPDLPLCDDCAAELQEPGNRRYRYPFINCTRCGPRYSIIQRLPYDRANTTMASFSLCPECQSEYQNPVDRRFHAEPIACPVCGPSLQFTDGRIDINDNTKALNLTVERLARGDIIAVKGIGGYHLMCDASNDDAVTRLRQRKPRPDKPLAVMLTAQQLQQHVIADEKDLALLQGTIHPILLLPKKLPKKASNSLSPHIAPGLNEIGVLLPYSPLHVLLLQDFGKPLVATSANISGEPVLTDNQEVTRRLGHVGDACLHHNRPIQRPADDPVYRVIAGKPRPLRLGRGNVPLELDLPFTLDKPTLAVGGHMKNTVALAWEQRIVISPHIGDLQSLRSQQVFEQVIKDLQNLYQVQAQQLVCDAHRDYASYRWAQHTGLPVHTVLHHHAHAAAVTAEFPHVERWLVFTWDGTGLGGDKTLWGGEALLGNSGRWQRVASMRPFHLPGGDLAARQPWRSAAALCWETRTPWQASAHISEEQIELLHQAWHARLNCIPTSAVGRLFDAAGALLDVCQQASFEGQGPMWLEAIALQEKVRNPNASTNDALPLPLELDNDNVLRSDWSLLLKMLTDERLTVAQRALRFHQTLALALLHQALEMREAHGEFSVGLTGGVFQNKLLSELVIELLQQHNFSCHLPQQIPANDAGLCYGQIMEYSASMNTHMEQP
jgi:hydrogenase maturation protein HypF